MFNPVLFLLVLLLVLAVAALISQIRPERARLVAPAAIALILALLLAARPAGLQLNSPGYLWSWKIHEANWWPSLALGLLALTGLLAARAGDIKQQGFWVLALLAAGLAATWANAPVTQVTTWSLLTLLIWFLVRTRSAARRGALLGLLGLAPLALWLAAASFPALANALELNTWQGPVLTETLWLLSALVVLGAFPFHFWRPEPEQRNGALVALVNVAPAAAGAVLLAWLAGGEAIASYALPLTLSGMLGLLWAAYLAWSRRVVMALLLGEASLVLLLGVWGTGEAVLAESRVLLLAGGAVMLARRFPNETTWRRLALVPAFLALAAFPLTAGFAGRGLLYTAWLDNERWLLIVVAVLTQIPVLAVGLTLVWPRTWPPGQPNLADLALLIPMVGLISWQELSSVSPLAWGAIALQIVGALALFRFAREASEWQQALKLALSVNLERKPDLAPLRETGRLAGNALREATAILEGEGGLLWIVLFLVIIWLAR